MNNIFSTQTWHLLGWTMLHFLWLGTALLIVSAIIRRALRRAGPNVRYAHSLATLLALAAIPIATATWLDPLPPPATASSSAGGFPPPSPPAQGEGTISATGSWGRSEAEPPARLDESFPPSAVRGSPDPALVTTEGLPTTPPPFIELNPNYTPQSNSPAEPGDDVESGAWGRSAGEPPARLAGGSPSARPQPPVSLLAALNTLVPYLPYLWLVGTPITFALLATGLLGAERMRRHGTPLNDGPVHEACERLRRSLRITRRVALAVCDRVAQPVLVGIVRPLILLPPVALTGWSPEELEMVLLHELAHVRRWDNFVNLAQRVIESLLFFHPAVWIASTWVRRDREECCDAVVVTRTQEPKQYAELLVSLASPQPLAGLALASHPLAARLRRILKLEDEPMLVSRNTIALLVVIFAVAAGIGYPALSAMGEAQPETTADVPSDEPPPTDQSPSDAPPTDVDPATQPLRSPPPSGEGLGEGGEPANGEPPTANTLSAHDEFVAPNTNSTSSDILVSMFHVPDEKRGELEKLLSVIRFGDQAKVKIVEDYLQIVAPSGEHDRIRDLFTQILGRDQIVQNGVRKPDWAPTNSQAEAGDSDPQPARLTRTYTLPPAPTPEIAKLEEWIKAQKDVGIEPLPSADGERRVIVHATKAEHDRFAKVLTDVSPKLPFLSLEDQQVADRAYRLLGIELEPLTQKELERVAKLGFKGGLKVTDANQGIVQGDLLVGLHVWQITSWESLNSVLTRDDLAEFSPLKFYVVRGETEFVPIDPTNVDRGGVNKEVDKVVTGRIVARLADGQAAAREELFRRRIKEGGRGWSTPTYVAQQPAQAPTPADSSDSAVPPPAATGEELEVLREHIKFIEEQYKRIDALFQEGARGGSAEKRDLVAYELSLAQGELALAEGRLNEALAKFEAARMNAEKALKTAQLAYENDFVTYDFLLQAAKNLAEIKRRIIQLQPSQAPRAKSPELPAQPARPPSAAKPYGSATQLGPRVGPTTPVPTPYTPPEPSLAPTAPQPSDHTPPARSSAALPWNPPTESPQSAPAQAPRAREGAPTWNPPNTESRWPTPVEAPAHEPALSTPIPPVQLHKGGGPTLTYTPAEAPVLDPATGQPQPRSVLEPQPTQPTPTPTLPIPQSAMRIPQSRDPVYRYDGKTFEQWRDEWKHELSTAKRIEGVKALAAFARTGQAKEAAEAIFEVAAEAKFSRPVPHNSDDHNLRTAIIGTLTAEWPIDPAIVFPMIMERFEKSPDEWRNFLASYLRSLKEAEPTVAQKIAALTEHKEPTLRSAALDALFHIDQSEFQDRVAEALTDSDSEVVINAMQKLSLVASRPERSGDEQSEVEEISLPVDQLTALVYHDDPRIQRTSLHILKRLAPQHGEKIAARLIEVLNDEARSDDRLNTIRFLGVIGEPASAAASYLLQIIKDSDDPELRIAAAVALDQIEPRKGQGRALLLDGVVGEEQGKLIELMNEEHRRIHGLPGPRR